ncbi:hypothetical protein BDV41DRAFT_536943 [Aspergillus transmontanensis]|uniref:Uncharacterized protein n=1 Tax=Aspergillus transmontanensis TaxID=1034304 RepID=A0A5N6VYC6_9EURO|nr:hypothetical protein BDV41DRAFT_536943 [Aspergillus transmontanensis]
MLTVDFATIFQTGKMVFIWTAIEWAVVIIVASASMLRPLIEHIIHHKIFQSFTKGSIKDTSAQEGHKLKTLHIPVSYGYSQTVSIHSRRQSAAEVGSIPLSPFMFGSSGSS